MPTGTKIAAIVLVVLLTVAGLYYAFVPPTPAPKIDSSKFGDMKNSAVDPLASRPTTLPPGGMGTSGTTGTTGLNGVSGTAASGTNDLAAMAGRQQMLNGGSTTTPTGSSGFASGTTVPTGSTAPATGTIGSTNPSGTAVPGATTGTMPTGTSSVTTPTATSTNTVGTTGTLPTGTTRAFDNGFRNGPSSTNLAGNLGSGSGSTTGSAGTPASGTSTTGAPSSSDNAASTATPGGTHVVKQGETMQTIAKQYYGAMSKWQSIAKANPTVDPNLMKVGTKLRIPAAPVASDKAIASASIPAATKSSKSATVPSTGIASSNTGKTGSTVQGSTVHVVAKGETLSSISKHHYGDSKLWKLIAKANPKIDANNLSVGAKLQIPPMAVTSGEKVTR